MTNNKNRKKKDHKRKVEPIRNNYIIRPLIVNTSNRQWNSGYQYGSWGHGDIGWFESDGTRADYEKRFEREDRMDRQDWGWGDTGWD